MPSHSDYRDNRQILLKNLDHDPYGRALEGYGTTNLRMRDGATVLSNATLARSY